MGHHRISSAMPVAAMATLLLITACVGGGSPLAGIIREPAPDVSSVVLPDVADGGTEFAARSEPGEILVLYFGYTSCPDICPTTLSDLRQAFDELGNRADQVKVAMVTVDPMRDTPQQLTAYVRSFFDDAHALRTEDADLLEDAAGAFGASYLVNQTAEGDIEVAHTSFLYAIDSTGHLLVQWPFGMTSEDMASDLERLLRRNT